MEAKYINGENFTQRLESDGYKGTESREQWYLLTHKSQLVEFFILENIIHSVQIKHFHEDCKISHEVGTGILISDTI